MYYMIFFCYHEPQYFIQSGHHPYVNAIHRSSFLAYLLSNMYPKNRDSSYPCSQPQSQSTPQPVPGSPFMFVEWIKNNLPAITPTPIPRYKCDFRINWTRELYSLSDAFNIFCSTLLSDSTASTSISSLLTIHLNEEPSILEVVLIISGCSDSRG